MKIGIGIDIVEIERSKWLYERYRKRLGKFLDDSELDYIRSHRSASRALANVLAIKEAVFKALGLAWFGLSGWRKIQVRYIGNKFSVSLPLTEVQINMISKPKYVVARAWLKRGSNG